MLIKLLSELFPCHPVHIILELHSLPPNPGAHLHTLGYTLNLLIIGQFHALYKTLGAIKPLMSDQWVSYAIKIGWSNLLLEYK